MIAKGFKAQISRTALIEAIKKNMTEHVKIFEEAVVGYRKMITEVLEKKLAAAKEGKRVSHYINLRQPVNHTKDYERVLQMLEMSTEEKIVINEAEFAMYVRDEWDWKHTFLASNSTYSLSAREQMDDDEEDEA